MLAFYLVVDRLGSFVQSRFALRRVVPSFLKPILYANLLLLIYLALHQAAGQILTCTIYLTRRTPAHIAQSLVDAKANNYALGVKLVRGAYHPHETAAYEADSTHNNSLSISPDPQPPVWSTKSDTDACFDECAKVLIGAVKNDILAGLKEKTTPPTIGVLFGTHNWASCDLILAELVNCGLAVTEPGENGVVRIGEDVTERLTMGQLYGEFDLIQVFDKDLYSAVGMSDVLTNYLVGRTRTSSPFVMKCVQDFFR